MRLRLTLFIAALVFALAPLAHSGIAPRIVGGELAAQGAHPFMAALVGPGLGTDAARWFCGATVIAPYAVLTAAHCVVDQNTGAIAAPADQVIVTGKADLAVAGGQHLAVRAVVVNPDYSKSTQVGDVAVLLLQTPTTAPPAALAEAAPTAGTTATILGWGATNAVSDPTLAIYSPALMAATVTVAPCSSIANSTFDVSTKVCAGSTQPNVCFGDSGGPLLVAGASGVQVAGVTSWTALPCGSTASAFSDVSRYRLWIRARLVPSISGVQVSAATAGKLHVIWTVAPGGEAPSISVRTTNGSVFPAAPGTTSLDIADLPTGIALGATVTVVNAFGSASSASAGTATLAVPVVPPPPPPPPPVPTTRRAPVLKVTPRISGRVRVGQIVTCTTGAWTATPRPSYTYGWRIGARISSRYRARRLQLTRALAGRRIACVVTARNAAGSAQARSHAVTVARR